MGEDMPCLLPLERSDAFSCYQSRLLADCYLQEDPLKSGLPDNLPIFEQGGSLQ